MFTLSFDVLYDFTIKQFNSHLATQFGIEETFHFENNCNFLGIISQPPAALTKVTISNDNVLDYKFLQQVKQFEDSINCTCIISFTDFVPLDHKSQFRNSNLVRYLNYDLNILTTFLFLGKLSKINHLIEYAGSLNVFILHDDNLELEGSTSLNLQSISTITDASSISAFIDYFLVQNSLYSYPIFIAISDLVIYTLIFGLGLFLYLTIANNHKIRSNIGLLFGWIIDVFVCTLASINVVTVFHRYQTWNLIIEPSTKFTRITIFIIVAMFSARGLFNSIEILTDSNESDIHKKLFQYYSGFKKILPIVSKTLATSLLGLSSLILIGIIVLYCCFQGDFLQSMLSRLSILGQICFLALIFEYFMELTFIAGIIVVDLKKMSLTDAIQDSNSSTNEISTVLLKLRYPSHSRPNEDSFRYKVGQLFLRTSFNKTTEVILYVLGLLLLHGIFIHWSLIMPKKDRIINLQNLQIINNTHTIIYFLEYALIIIFILAIAGIIFRFNPPNPIKSTTELSCQDFVENEKQFNSISLENGHSLDIVKIKTNSKCSFVVTIGLDHKVLIWSPLSKISKPIDISSKENGKEFWPINHVAISEDGDFIILINFKFGIIKCFNRTDMVFTWIHQNNDFISRNNKRPKILESFFRKKTVPGFLARQMLNQMKNDSRRGSDVSINGNFPPPPISMKSFGEQQREIAREPTPDNQLNKDEFVIVLETGALIVYSCNDGKIKCSNIITSLYGHDTTLKVLSAKKLRTPRINDRIICQIDNSDLIVATVINNIWKFRKLEVKQGKYNQENKINQTISPVTVKSDYDFGSAYKEKSAPILEEIKGLKLNVACLVPLEFLGMVVVVKNLICELIDIQTGIVLKTFNIANFKPNSFRVTHSEPTHCKFCGCASISTLTIVYEDFDSKTIITQTYKIDEQRSKSNICLRVERDPREIRCLGLNAVTEHQYWYRNIVSWEMTDVNMIIGIAKRNQIDNDEEETVVEVVEKTSGKRDKFDQLIENRGLMSLRNRRKHSKPEFKLLNDIYEGFIITVSDGKRNNYQLPPVTSGKLRDFSHERINAIEKYGFKSIICNFGNLLEVYYLGNDKLIEQDIYYNPDIWSQDNKSNGNKQTDRPPQNSELLFINKRRTMGKRR
ncbi:hypothetical protein JA1_002909 [Spathaspora sp. JA1]|nr:hypothetical protein JA1_002909 [Spathaspora sp. JA1]